MRPDKKGDAGWLRGQTTRRRYHRRPDGGPERRQWCPDGGPEHRYEWYTAGPPYVSRPNGNKSRNAILATRLPPRCTSSATKSSARDLWFRRESLLEAPVRDAFCAGRYCSSSDGGRRAGRFVRCSRKPRVLSGSRPPLAKMTAM